MGAETIAKSHVAADFRTTLGIDMNVDVALRSSEHPVLVPVGLTHSQLIAGRFERGKISGFVRGILDNDENVDDGLGCEPGNRRRPDMQNSQCSDAQHPGDRGPMHLELRRPGRVVILDEDLALLDATDELGCHGHSLVPHASNIVRTKNWAWARS